MVDVPATRLAAAPPVVQLAAWSSGGVIDGPRVAFSCARGRAGRRRPQVTGEATRHRVPVAPRAWARRPRGAPATPRRREGPGMAVQHSGRTGFLGLGSVLHSKRIPWRRDQPGHRSLGRRRRLRRQRKCGKFPQALPAVRSELRPSGIVVPVWDGFSLGRRIYDG
jgi:hypothetical protein